MAVIQPTLDGNQKLMLDCWYPDFLNKYLACLKAGEQTNAETWIHKYVFDVALKRPSHRVNVTQAIRDHVPNPPAWTGGALQPLWDCTQDEETASWVYGNLVCRVGIKQRPETWWVYKLAVGYDRSSSTYILNI